MRRFLSPQPGLLVTGALGFALMGVGQSVYGPALPAWIREFGLTQTAAGVILSAPWVGAILAVLAMLRIGHRFPAWAAIALAAAGQALVAFAPDWPIKVAGAALFGTGAGFATVIFNRRVLSAFGLRGPAMVGAINALYGIGAIGGPLIYLALGAEPDRSYALTAAAGLLLCLYAWRAVPAEGPLRASDLGDDTVAPTQTAIAPPAILAIGGIAIGLESILIGLGPSALIATGLTEARAAGLLSGFFVCFLATRLSLLWLASRVAPLRLLAAALMLTLVFALCATLSPALFFVLCGAPAGLYFPTYFVTATARLGRAAHAAPVIIVAGMAGGVAAPLITGAAMAIAAGPGPAFFLTVAAGALVPLVLALRGLSGGASVIMARRA